VGVQSYDRNTTDPSNEEGFLILERFGLGGSGEETGSVSIMSAEDDGEL